MKNFLKAILPVIFLFILWQSVVVIFDLPHYILPKPKVEQWQIQESLEKSQVLEVNIFQFF